MSSTATIRLIGALLSIAILSSIGILAAHALASSMLGIVAAGLMLLAVVACRSAVTPVSPHRHHRFH